jgi:hypothetical protein
MTGSFFAVLKSAIDFHMFPIKSANIGFLIPAGKGHSTGGNRPLRGAHRQAPAATPPVLF